MLPQPVSAPPKLPAIERRRWFKASPAPRIAPDVESSTERYAERFSGSVGEWFLAEQARHVMESLSTLPSRLKVLDVGGGHAQLVPALVEGGHDVVVLGSTPDCGTRLRPWTGDGKCRFDVGDMMSLPYPNQSFDVAVSVRILSHLSNPDALIAELCRVSRLAVVVDYPSRRGLNQFADSLFAVKLWAEHRTTRRFQTYWPGEMRRMFFDEGFAVTSERPQYFWPMALHRMLGSATVASTIELPMAPLLPRFGSPVIQRAERMSPAGPVSQLAPQVVRSA